MTSEKSQVNPVIRIVATVQADAYVCVVKQSSISVTPKPSTQSSKHVIYIVAAAQMAAVYRLETLKKFKAKWRQRPESKRVGMVVPQRRTTSPTQEPASHPTTSSHQSEPAQLPLTYYQPPAAIYVADSDEEEIENAIRNYSSSSGYESDIPQLLDL